MVMHVRTIAVMPEDAKGVSTRHALTLEEVAELLPGTGELMASVGECWWKCAYAAHGGNWPLAAYEPNGGDRARSTWTCWCSATSASNPLN